MDFVLEMHAADHPDQFRFVRDAGAEPVHDPERLAAWERVLTGAAREAFMPKLPLAALRRWADREAQALAALQAAARN